MTTKVIIAGFKGKMGSTAVQMVKDDQELELAALLDPFAAEEEVDGVPVFRSKEDLIGFEADVWVDFTTPKFAYENTRFALENGFAPVVGTTGFTPEEIQELTSLSEEKKLGGLIAPNFAIGAILLMEFAAKASKYFPDVEIIELHHDKKKDAPSGTALAMGEAIAGALDKDLKDCAVYSREGYTGERVPGTIGFATVRAGDIVGEHTAMFADIGERVEITHKASSRMTFANGAVRSALWLKSKKNGLFDMRDVLNLNEL